MAGPAFSAMIGNVNTMLIEGAMCVMPWNTTWGRPRALRRRCVAAVGLVDLGSHGDPPEIVGKGGYAAVTPAQLRNRFRKVLQPAS